MKVAIPIRNGRVSPVFDAASRLVIVEFEDCEPAGRSEFPVREGGRGARAALLRDLGVSTLICGAISNRTALIVERYGIELLPWIVGDIEDVIDAYRSGTLGSEGLIMPGCRRRHGKRHPNYGRRRSGGGRRNRE